jgi:hypothetical protein
MAIGSLGWWQVIVNFFKGLWQSYQDYKRRQRLRKESREEAKKEFNEALRTSDPSKLTNAFRRAKRNKE